MSERILPLDPAGLEKKLSYTFKDKQLLLEALTHSSYINEHRTENEDCNERLEFFGDSVLSVIVSRYLFSKFTSRQEGDMTKIRAAVVCEKALAKYAREIDLGDYLRMGKGEEKTNGRQRASVTSDAFEAVLAAMYIDSGYDADTVANFLMPFVVREINDLNTGESFVDYKTSLQQIIQQADGERLQYAVVEESGPDHDKTFVVEARLNSNVIGVGRGSSKREAEQSAAKEALKLFGAETNG